MKKVGYKANRPTPQELDLRFAKGHLKMQLQLIERYHRVNAKQAAKGLPPKHDQEKINALEDDIEKRRQSIAQMVAHAK